MNYEKYINIAHMNPAGIDLSKEVVNRWDEWLSLVEESIWLRSFKNLRRLRGKPSIRASIPEDDWNIAGCPAVAKAVYVSAVWGFGVERKHETDVYWRREMARLQGSTVPLAWSVDIFNTADPLPIPFRDLDMWLEHLWL